MEPLVQWRAVCPSPPQAKFRHGPGGPRPDSLEGASSTTFIRHVAEINCQRRFATN